MVAQLNARLASEYSKFLPACQRLAAERPGLSKPLLLKVPSGYASCARKLMIVGQETLGWGSNEGWDVEELMNGYQDWNLGEAYRSPFWSAAHQIAKALSPDGPERVFLWSNLVKMDEGGRPPHSVEEEIAKHPILQTEIAICRPDTVIFFTGPNYDDRIRATFPATVFTRASAAWPERAFAQLRHPELPKHSFRTYHPNYLQRRKKLGMLQDLITLLSISPPKDEAREFNS